MIKWSALYIAFAIGTTIGVICGLYIRSLFSGPYDDHRWAVLDSDNKLIEVTEAEFHALKTHDTRRTCTQ